MTLDEQIRAEGRLEESQELALYNMSLRQTSQRAAGTRGGTHVLLDKIENDPAYMEMIERGLLEIRHYGRGGTSSSAATLLVTKKGFRYCVLYSDEIEPRRAYDVAGTRRVRLDEGSAAWGDGSRASNYAEVTSGLASGYSAAKSAAVALTAEQVEHLEEIGAQRRISAIRKEGTAEQTGPVGRRCEFETEAGEMWAYETLGDDFARIVGVSGRSGSLRIPARINDRTVTSIAEDALSMLDFVEEIICPDSITSIGARAFRLNPKLRRLVLPADVNSFQDNWIARCPNLEEMVLPGMVGEITRGMLESPRLKKLVVGREASRIEPGAFQDANLEEVFVAADNPHIVTDGTALYTKDGTELIALARPVERLAIAEGCRKLAKKSCCGFARLRLVECPETLVEIGAFAFSRTGLERFDAPASLRVIGEKAFFGCSALASVSLDDCLETIGDSAFEGAAIGGLAIPASIVRLGKSATKGTNIVHSGPGCTLAIADGCNDLFLDGAGGLYRRRDDGIHLVQLVDDDLEAYDVHEDAVAIDPYAFAYHDNISFVRVARSVTSIGRSAFRVCKALRNVELPDSIESIGEEAFFDTNLERFRVPASLRDLGECALVSYGAHHGGRMPSLADIEVPTENDTFFMASGMLCRKTATGASVVVYTGAEERVVFPQEVTHVEKYAFANARGIDYLALNPRLSSIGSNGMATSCWIRHIHVELEKPLEGRTSFDFFFPDTPRAVRDISIGLGGASWVNVPGLIEQLDLCLLNARDYNAPGKQENVSAYAQAKLILERLEDRALLKPYYKTSMERLIRNNIEDICVDVALHDDRGVFDELIEHGFVNADNLERVIERVGALRDAATSAYLLETKRQKFSADAFDYDL